MTDRRAFTRLLSGQMHKRRLGIGDDEAIASLAGRQHGVVRRRQLLELAVSPDAIDYRLRAGRLRRMHPGVYAAGHNAVGHAGRALAAVASFGASAWASHLTALALRGVITQPRGLHVTYPHARARRRGVEVHRAELALEEFSLVDGIPTSTAARALLDLSSTCPPDRLRRLLKRAEFEHEVTLHELEILLAAHPRRPGRKTLADLVEILSHSSGRSRSELEDRFHDFLRRRDLPIPETNVIVDAIGRRIEVDCLWSAQRLVVELDGARAHQTAASFEDDRARDRALVAAGFAVMRVTWTHLHADEAALERELRAALGLLQLDARALTRP